ncbi:hypothetical protein N9R54_05045 [Pelobium sp.]|nr:hypothetical protein [Pelobium sp.]MDA9555584.1 hypothetical protein [Pelobium sp.]
MDNNQVLTLIQGEFTPNETIEILFSLINEKIRFHDLQILGIKEGKEGNAEPHLKRIEELTNTKKAIQELVAKAKQNNNIIAVNSSIQLELKTVEEPVS